MNIVEQLHELTFEFQHSIQNTNQENDREKVIENINDFLNKREELISKIPEDLSEQEKKLGKNILNLNNTIETILNDFFKGIVDDLRNSSNKKNIYNKYNANFVSGDGMFFDKRK